METNYHVERIQTYEKDLKDFLIEETPKISEMFGNTFNPERAALGVMIEKGIFLVGRRNGEIKGIHISWLTSSALDINVKILQQQLFYVKPDSGRMAYYLFNKFIDIGKSEANHIITMLTRNTNIKPTTLQNLGFKELEVLYRLEVSK